MGGSLDPLGRTARHEAAIYNAAYMVRHYWRGATSSLGRAERAEAIKRMGLAVRDAFTECDDYERLLTVVFKALSKHDDPPF